MDKLEQTLEFSGKQLLTPPEKLLYWIAERNQIMLKKELGLQKPWSSDEVFQRTYFCNVRREHDRVTRYIREMYSPEVLDPWFLYNIIFSRFINWPATLGSIGYLRQHNPGALDDKLSNLAKRGKIWGGAYVITTHGIPMAKASYLCNNVLGGAYKARELLYSLTGWVGTPSLAVAHKALQSLEGLGSFLAAQVVADLKNTPGHPLHKAFDWNTFVAPGPGSIRGLSWFWSGVTITPGNFQSYFKSMREYVDDNWDQMQMGQPICNQDLQNCLCEYDKYMRVSNGTGKSKRNYAGA